MAPGLLVGHGSRVVRLPEGNAEIPQMDCRKPKTESGRNEFRNLLERGNPTRSLSPHQQMARFCHPG
ncbi:hypothetical protein XFF6970_290050 [Xanthomonas citri pv. fuscans]|nr:hypothetical protein XFF6970_290050 [Xanthomonas citri pv. fuscans]